MTSEERAVHHIPPEAKLAEVLRPDLFLRWLGHSRARDGICSATWISWYLHDVLDLLNYPEVRGFSVYLDGEWYELAEWAAVFAIMTWSDWHGNAREAESMVRAITRTASPPS